MRRAGEALVAAPSGAAAGDDCPLSWPDEVVPGAIALEHRLGAGRDAELELRAVGPVPERALAVTAAAGLEVRLAAVGLEIAQRVVADQDDIAAAAAVAPVRTALGHVRLTAKAEAAVTAGARLYVNPCSIVHLKGLFMLRAGRISGSLGRPSPALGLPTSSGAAGVHEGGPDRCPGCTGR